MRATQLETHFLIYVKSIANHGGYWNVLYHNIKFNLDNLKKRHLGNLL